MEQTPNVRTLMNVPLLHRMMLHQSTHVMQTQAASIMMEVTSENPTQLTLIQNVSTMINVPNQLTLPKWKAVQLILLALILMILMSPL